MASLIPAFQTSFLSKPIQYLQCLYALLRSGVLPPASLSGMIAVIVLISNPLPSFAAQELEEIVVTARFREENLQVTPIAITALTGEGLEERSLTTVHEIGDFAPNTILSDTSSGFGPTMVAYIRGIGATDFSLSIEPGVAIYIDDIYHGRPTGSQLDLLDLERVEILRGPQGTLFGKNAIGGAIRLIPKKPQGDGAGYIEVTTGSYDRLDFRGSYDGKLIEDKLFARVSASSKKRDGYFDVIDYGCANPGDLQFANSSLGNQVGRVGISAADCIVDEMGDVDVESFRAAIRWIAGEDLEVNVAADYTIQDQKEPANKQPVISVCTTCSGPAFFSASFANSAASQAAYGIPWDQRFLTSDNFSTYERADDPATGRKAGNQNDIEHWGIAGVIDWDFGKIHVKSISAYREFTAEFSRGSDGSPLPITMTHDLVDHEQFTQEVQISGVVFADKLDWTVGGFYYDGTDTIRNWLIFFPGVGFLATANNDALDNGETTNIAGFVHGVYHWDDKLSLTAGVRVTKDEKTQNLIRTYAENLGQRPVNPATGLPFNVGDVFLQVTDTELSETVDTYKAGIDYQWTEDLMTYFQWSTGFRGGGLQARPTSALQAVVFGSDRLETYEIGIKSDWFDGTTRLNGAAFYSNWTDLQLPSVGTDLLGNPAFITLNAGEAEIIGVELELQTRPMEGLAIEATLGYVGFDYGDLGKAGAAAIAQAGFNPASAPCQECRSVRNPKWTYSIGGSYTFPLGELGSLTLRADYSYQSKFYYDAPNTAVEPAIGLLNARATWDSVDDKWSASIFGTNITDEFYCGNQLSFDNATFGRVQCSTGPPAMWGLSVKYRFGG